jgi:hypothetical protein
VKREAGSVKREAGEGEEKQDIYIIRRSFCGEGAWAAAGAWASRRIPNNLRRRPPRGLGCELARRSLGGLLIRKLDASSSAQHDTGRLVCEKMISHPFMDRPFYERKLAVGAVLQNCVGRFKARTMIFPNRRAVKRLHAAGGLPVCCPIRPLFSCQFLQQSHYIWLTK